MDLLLEGHSYCAARYIRKNSITPIVTTKNNQNKTKSRADTKSNHEYCMLSSMSPFILFSVNLSPTQSTFIFSFDTDLENLLAQLGTALYFEFISTSRSSNVVIITVKLLINAIIKMYTANNEILSEFSGIFWYATMTYTTKDRNTIMDKLDFSPDAGGKIKVKAFNSASITTGIAT